MVRHQVLQHSLASCTSVIPHPFCQRHTKDPTSMRHSESNGPAPLPRTAAPADAPCRCRTHPQSQQLDHPPKHPHPSTSSSTLSLSIRTTLLQRNNSNSSAPRRNNSNSSVDKAMVWFGKSPAGVEQRAVWLALLLYPPHPPQLNIHRMSEPGNCSVKTQLGSTNSKGLPVLSQGLPPRNATK